MSGRTPAVYAATTYICPCILRVGRTAISTSRPRAVSSSIRRPTEKLPDLLRISRDTCGLPDAEQFGRLNLSEAPLLDDGVDFQCQACLQKLLLGIGKPQVREYVPAAFRHA